MRVPHVDEKGKQNRKCQKKSKLLDKIEEQRVYSQNE